MKYNRKVKKTTPYYKKKNYKKGGKARPMYALKQNYRSLNVYRFCRETIPSTATFTIIPAANHGAMGYMSFENLQFNQLPGNTDFQNLYARYKVDKIVTCLTPLFQEAILGANWPTPPAGSPQLEITRINTKWLVGDFPIAANSDLQLTELAQLQSKSKSLYASKKCLYITTLNPGVVGNSVVNSAGNEVNARRGCPWLALSGPHQSIDVPFKHNSIIMARKIDGGNIDATFKYSITHKIYFRCSQVG